MSVVDLRSDTVTLPTEAMRHAMANAPLGDDVFGEDPTINALQERAAEMLGKQAGLFVPSGTMGNQLGVLVNAPRGSAVITDARSHVFLNEAGGSAVIGSVQIVPVMSERGVLSRELIGAAIASDDHHHARSAAVVLENTHNAHGGVVWPISALHDACDFAHEQNMRVHLDGARIFNAAVATNTDVAEICSSADTVTFCLSKGLSCPVGSVFCATVDAVEEAKRWRKMLGGGMRQAGVLAAAGLVALESTIDRLANDHANARRLAEGLAELSVVSCDLSRVQSNIVYFDVPDASAFVGACAKDGILGLDFGRSAVRFVTHRGIESSDIERALLVCAKALRG